jgi:hypothetical protein
MALKRRILVVASLSAFGLVACLSSSSNGPTAGGDAGGVFGDAGGGSSDTGPPGPPPEAGASTCAPANVQSYVPKWVPPKAPAQACTAAQISSYADCVASGDPASGACAAWSGDAGPNGTCLSCLAPSALNDAAWGPLVLFGTSELQLNVPGCLALVLHDTGSGCAGSYQALYECEAQACYANCQGSSSAALLSCTSAADNGGCSAYLSPAACAGDAGPGTADCIGTAMMMTTFAERFTAIAQKFCLQTTDGG